MTNAFPPPRPSDAVSKELSVVPARGPAWPKKKWLKVPMWAWIASAVLGVGAVSAANNPKPVGQSTVAASSADTSPRADAIPASSSSPATAPAPPSTAPATPPPTAAPTPPPTAAPTPPPTAAPTPPPTAAPTPPATAAPTPPTAAPTPPPTPAPTPPPTTPPPPPAPPATSAKPLASNGCDPNYSPCVPIDSDVDCASGKGNGPSYVQGPVQVIGSDIYGLDRDGDGIGCE